KRIALLQHETHAAVVGNCTGSWRTVVAARRSSADFVDPPEGIDSGASVWRRKRNARNRFRLGDHQDVEHAVLAREHRRLGEYGQCRFASACERNQEARYTEPPEECCYGT